MEILIIAILYIIVSVFASLVIGRVIKRRNSRG